VANPDAVPQRRSPRFAILPKGDPEPAVELLDAVHGKRGSLLDLAPAGRFWPSGRKVSFWKRAFFGPRLLVTLSIPGWGGLGEPLDPVQMTVSHGLAEPQGERLLAGMPPGSRVVRDAIDTGTVYLDGSPHDHPLSREEVADVVRAAVGVLGEFGWEGDVRARLLTNRPKDPDEPVD
jgi:hypothetical protein